MSKKNNKTGKVQQPEPEVQQSEPEVQETVMEDEQSQEQVITLSFSEKIASIFAPVRSYKENLAASEARCEQLNEALQNLADEHQKNLEELNARAELQLSSAQATAKALHDENEALATDKKFLELQVESLKKELNKAKDRSFDIIILDKLHPSIKAAFSTPEAIIDAICTAAAPKPEPKPVQNDDDILQRILTKPSDKQRSWLKTWCADLLGEMGIVRGFASFDIAMRQLADKDDTINKLKAEIKVLHEHDHEADICKSFESDTLSDRLREAVAPWLRGRINALIDIENKHLAEVQTLDEQLKALADKAAAPGEHDEAIDEGIRRVLKPLSGHLGHDIKQIDELADALATYFDERLHKEVLARFIAADNEQRASLDALVTAANAAMADRAKINRLLTKLASDNIETIYNDVLQFELKRLKEKYTIDKLPEAIRSAFIKESFESLINALVKAAEKLQKDLDAAKAAREQADAAATDLRHSLDNAIAEAAEVNEQHKSQLKKINEEHKAELQRQKEADAAAMTARCDELESKHKAAIDSLDARLKTAQTDIAGLFDACLDNLHKCLDDMHRSLDRAYTGSDRYENCVAELIDNTVFDNDMYGLDEFRDKLIDRLNAAKDTKTADSIRNAVRDTFTELLKIESATWIDSLARLSLYARVPFIAESFMKNGINIDCFARAYADLEAILDCAGISIKVPRLFVDNFDESNHNAEAIKNITQLVADVASHVQDPDTIIDLFTIGYSIDDKEIRKPTVSRLNS